MKKKHLKVVVNISLERDQDRDQEIFSANPFASLRFALFASFRFLKVSIIIYQTLAGHSKKRNT